MRLRKQKIIYYSIYIVFILFNILNTYFLTTQSLNRYSAPVTRSVIGEITSIIGNAAILLLIIIIGIAIFKKDKNRFRYLTSVTLFLNVLIFALGIFTMYYSTSFSINGFDLLKNPAEGVTSGVSVEIWNELFNYYRIVLFVPFIIMAVLTRIYTVETKKTLVDTLNYLTGIKTIVLLGSFLLLIGFSSGSYLVQISKDDFLLGATSSTKGTQNYGVYPYYVTNFLGIHFEVTTRESMNINSDQDVYNSYQQFNKNQESYLNIIDNKTYSNNLTLGNSKVEAHDLLNLNSDSSLNGIFKDKNLVLVQMESLNYFLWQLNQSNSQFKFMNEIFKESFVFENYYTSVGLGGTSDAESTLLTGLNMNGYSTFYRSYDFNKYQIDTLPNLLKGYDSLALHGGFEDFYNRKDAYPNLLEFTENFISIETFAKEAGYSDPYKYHKFRELYGLEYPHYKFEDKLKLNAPWPSEFELSDIVYEQLEKVNKQFTFSVFMTPHTPYHFNPLTNNFIDKLGLNSITKRYLDYANYIDLAVESYFVDPKTGNERPNIDNNVYVFYSDHGSALKNGDLSKLFNKKLSLYEERRILQQTVAFIYAPSGIQTDTPGVHEGLIKGTQNLTRSHVDLYRTIGNMFGVFGENDFYFGVSGFSYEPTYALDNRIQDIIVDDTRHLDSENYTPMFLSLRNNKFRSSNYNEKELLNEEKVLSYIKSFRKYSDLLISDKDIYQDYKKTLQMSSN